MSADTGTETTTIPCCAVCLATDDAAHLRNWGKYYRPYWLCVDTKACVDRATAEQHAAREAVLRAVETAKAALEAGDEDPAPEGKHAATGPLKAITDAAVAEMAETAEKTADDAPADGEACHE